MHSLHGLTGAYALDALDDDEQAQMVHHLASCADCRTEVESFHLTMATFASLSEQAPPAWLRGEVLESIKSVRPLPPQLDSDQGDRATSAEVPDGVVADTSESQVPSSADKGGVVIDARRRFGRIIAASAAVAAALIAIAIVVWPTASTSSNPTKVTATEQVRKAADAKSVSLELSGGASATVVVSRSLGKAVIITDQMPKPPAGKVYQLWYLGANNTYTSAGVMNTMPSQSVALKGDATNSIAVGITMEPTGGSKSPTGSPIATFSLPS